MKKTDSFDDLALEVTAEMAKLKTTGHGSCNRLGQLLQRKGAQIVKLFPPKRRAPKTAPVQLDLAN